MDYETELVRHNIRVLRDRVKVYREYRSLMNQLDQVPYVLVGLGICVIALLFV